MNKTSLKICAGSLTLIFLVSCISNSSTNQIRKKSVDELNLYADIVHTIFEQNCITCHNAKDLKGELNMETYQGLMDGGDSGYSIAPGNKEDSELYFRITLPHDDEDFMPAEDKPPLSETEIAIIGWWIDQGAAPFKTVAEYAAVSPQISEYFQEIFDSMLSPEELEQREKDRQALYANMATISNATGALIIPVEPEASEFSIETFSVQSSFDDQALSQMEPYATAFVEADFSNTQLTDNSLLSLAKFKNLKSLNLSNTKIQGSNLGHLASLKKLQSLNLYGTGLTQDRIDELSKLTQLKKLYLFQTDLYEPELIARLKEALPHCNFTLN